MINHFFTCLYGYAVQPASGIFVPLTSPIVFSDTLQSGLAAVRGSTPAAAEAFALQGIKVVDASSYTKEITAKDLRKTYLESEIGVDLLDSRVYLQSVVELPGSVLVLALKDADVAKTFRSSDLLQERAAAVLVGLVRQVSADNGY